MEGWVTPKHWAQICLPNVRWRHFWGTGIENTNTPTYRVATELLFNMQQVVEKISYPIIVHFKKGFWKLVSTQNHDLWASSQPLGNKVKIGRWERCYKVMKREKSFVHSRERQITLSNVMQDNTKSLMGCCKNPQRSATSAKENL